MERKVARDSTGVAGLDELTGGGFALGRTTLVTGGPGAGKTPLALEVLARAAGERGEPGLFVAFEEPSEQLRADVASFGWGVHELIGRDQLRMLLAPAGDPP